MFLIRSEMSLQDNALKMVFARQDGDGTLFVFNFHTGQIRQIEPGEQIPGEFIFTVPWPIADEFRKAMSDMLAEKGIKPDRDAKIEGTLEATRYHLEDLRTLLKLKAK